MDTQRLSLKKKKKKKKKKKREKFTHICGSYFMNRNINLYSNQQNKLNKKYNLI